MDEALVEGLGALGFTRASLGVQDIAPEVQARIGRPQPAEMVRVGWSGYGAWASPASTWT
ncbi:hypothetical protein ACFQU7_26150 [Pseudoroseomonas wenyumeiae]